MSQKIFRSTLILKVWLTLFGPSFGQTTELRMAVESEFQTLHPMIDNTLAAKRVKDAVTRGLFKLDLKGRPQAVLVEQVPSLANKMLRRVSRPDGSEGMQVDVKFRKEAVWGDGTALSCADLQLAWEIGNSTSVTVPSAEDYQAVEKVEALASGVCRLHYKRPKYDFVVSPIQPIPNHLERPIFEKYKKEALGYDRNTLYVKDLQNPGLYNGPMRVAEWRPGSHLTLVENEKYQMKKPSIKKLVIKIIPNTSSLEPALFSGQVDMIGSGLSMDKVLLLEKKIAKDGLPYRIDVVSASAMSWLALNLENPILEEKKLRQALHHAIDKKGLSKAFFENRQAPVESFGTKLDPWYTEDPKFVTLYPYNPRKAQQILEELGWKMGPSGIREKDGKKLSLEFATVADGKLSEMIAVWLKDSFKKIGVDLQIKLSPARIFFSEVVTKRKFQLAAYATIFSPDWNPRAFFDPDGIPSEKNGFSGFNRSGLKNMELIRLLSAAEVELDAPKRIPLMRQAVKIITEENPYIPLYYRSLTAVVPLGLKNFSMSPHSSTEFYEIENWQFAKAP